MNQMPWYHPGLCFQCTQCGNCCTGESGAVWVSDEEIARIAEHLGCSVGEIRLMHTRLIGNRTSLAEYANGDCTFFDPQSRTCRIYPVRPRQCRSWPFWRSHLTSRHNWEQIQKKCPGAGQGPLIPVDQIEELAGLIDL